MTTDVSADFASLLLKAWQGEVFGVEVFATLAERQTDPASAAKLRELVALEEHMESQLSDLLDRLGIAPDLGDIMAVADEDIRAQSNSSWSDLLAWLDTDAETALNDYLLMLDCAPDDGDAVRLVRDVIAHERALMEFCALERAGDPDSLLAVRSLLPEATR